MEWFEGTGAELLVESLIRAGVRHVFGLPGDTGVTLYDALYHRQGRIQYVLTRDERHAAIMADAYARSTNTVGVCEASSGGGVMYLLGGLGEAYAASLPILAITTDIHRRSRGTGALTEINQTQLFRAVTKWQAVAETAEHIPQLVAEALTAATTGRPAPVSLVIPEDVMDERAHAAIPSAGVALPRVRTPSNPDTVQQAAQVLSAARQPGIVVGSGVHASGAWAALEEFVAAAGIPIATTIQGKGSISETHPLSLGVTGANGARTYANEYLADADVVFFIGTRANATDTNLWSSPTRGKATVIQCDIEASRAGRNFPGSIALVGDARTTLEQLLDALPQPNGVTRQWPAWIQTRCSAWQAEHEQRATLPEGRLNPRDVVRVAQRIAGDRAQVVGEPGTATPNLSAYWEMRSAGRSVIIPRGHGAMGYAIPAAIGAAFAKPDMPIVAFTSDGSFAMACGELETAARYKLPIVWVQFNNGSMGWIKMLQHLYMDRRYFGVQPGTIDYAGVANAMGLRGVRVRSLDEFAQALTQALESGAPTYLDVPVPEPIDLTPPVAPWQAALAGKTDRPVY